MRWPFDSRPDVIYVLKYMGNFVESLNFWKTDSFNEKTWFKLEKRNEKRTITQIWTLCLTAENNPCEILRTVWQCKEIRNSSLKKGGRSLQRRTLQYSAPRSNNVTTSLVDFANSNSDRECNMSSKTNSPTRLPSKCFTRASKIFKPFKLRSDLPWPSLRSNCSRWTRRICISSTNCRAIAVASSAHQLCNTFERNRETMHILPHCKKAEIKQVSVQA